MAIIEKKKLSQKVVDEIQKMMIKGDLKIGDKLPNQNKLSEQLGVSRTSLREAMNILDLLGVIEQRPGYGTVIRKKIPEFHTERLRPTLLADSKATKELLEARHIVESGTARLAAQNATKDQIRTLSKLVDQMQVLLDEHNYKLYARADLKFHNMISELCKNRFVKEAFFSIKQHMEMFIDEHIQFQPDVLIESQAHHKEIFKSILEHVPESAQHEMENHISFLQKSFQSFKKSRPSSTNEE